MTLRPLHGLNTEPARAYVAALDDDNDADCNGNLEKPFASGGSRATEARARYCRCRRPGRQDGTRTRPFTPTPSG